MNRLPLAPSGEVLVYQNDDGLTRAECRFEHEAIWLSQSLLAELFQTSPQNITIQIKGIYDEGEADEAATCKDYLQVRIEGGREVRLAVKHYNLDVIQGDIVHKHDATVAKNYLNEEEIRELNRVVTMWLDYAEVQARRRKQVFLKDNVRSL